MLITVRKFWQICLALPYDDGPSTTRWGYLVAVHSCALALLWMVVTFSYTYVRTGKADIVFAGVITSFMGVVVGFTATTVNLKHKLDATTGTTESGPEPKKSDSGS